MNKVVAIDKMLLTKPNVIILWLIVYGDVEHNERKVKHCMEDRLTNTVWYHDTIKCPMSDMFTHLLKGAPLVK